MSFLTYAQNFEDLMLWRALKHVENGFFIDVGAMSPDEHTVTRAFHERGWRGINIEPNPAYLSQLKTRRPTDINLGIAVGEASGQMELKVFDDTGLSTVEEDVVKAHVHSGLEPRSIIVDVKTITEIFEEYVPAGQDVHFLKVDVEGHEEQVLRGGNWSVNRPWIIVVEATFPNTQIEAYKNWEDILLQADYQMVYWDGLNRFYLAQEQMELLSAFAAPPNVFDNFEIAYFSNRIRELAEDVRHSKANSAAKEALVEDLQQELATERSSLRILKADFAAREALVKDLQKELTIEKSLLRKLSHELTYARSRSHRLFGNYLQYKALKMIVNSGLPLSKRTRKKFTASMNKRDPKRSLLLDNDSSVFKRSHGFDGQASKLKDQAGVTNADAVKLRHRQVCRDALDEFLISDERLTFQSPESPKVSVLLVLFNQAELTFQCLKSLKTQSFSDFEVIICDNGSNDKTHDLLERLDGVHVLNNSENLHFLLGVNSAAKEARGEFILLLNNDACVEHNALEVAVQRLEESLDVGAVGGPIVLVDGTLQEAGSIVFSDGSCAGYGRGRNPEDLEFQFQRDVDYCSGAFLLIRGSAWNELDGFDEAFAPAYYEETDFCMRLRKHGYRVIYDPMVRILHFEFGSSGKSSEAFAMQDKNRNTFREIHHEALKTSHGAPSDNRLKLRERREARPRILFIDDWIPYDWRGAGAPRAAEMLRAIAENGWSSTLFPLADPYVDSAEAYCTVPATTELTTGELNGALSMFLKERKGCFDAILVSRPHNMKKFLDAVASDPSVIKGVPLYYDAEALFSERDRKLAELTGGPTKDIADAIRSEMALADTADVIFSVSAVEAQKFRDNGKKNVHVLSHGIVSKSLGSGPETRQNALFVGRLQEDFSPNTDSLVWFVETIMPLIDNRIGTNWSLKVIGMAGSKARELASDRVKILGRTDNLDAFYINSRLLIAPTRYASGIPLKILEAASKGLPVVSTQLLADQLEWSNGVELLSAETAEAFADRFATLWNNDSVWWSLRDAALDAVARDYNKEKFAAVFASALKSFGPGGAARQIGTVRAN